MLFALGAPTELGVRIEPKPSVASKRAVAGRVSERSTHTTPAAGSIRACAGNCSGVPARPRSPSLEARAPAAMPAPLDRAVHAARRCTSNCSFLVFRHLAKTGGMTVAYWLSKLQNWADEWRGSWVGDDSEVHLHELSGLAQEVLRDPAAFAAAHPRTFAIFHKRSVSGFGVRFMPALLRIRAALERVGCRVVFATVVREPISYAVSSYNYHVHDFQMQKKFVGGIVNFTGRDELSQQLAGLPRGMIRTKRGFKPAEERALFEQLERDGVYDIVGTTDRFDETLALISRAVGIEDAHVRYWHANTAEKRRHTPSWVSLDALRRDAAQMAGLRNLSAVDQRVYAWASARLQAQLEAHGAELAALLGALRVRGLAIRGKQWVGGPPPPDRYVMRRLAVRCGRRVSWKHTVLPKCVWYSAGAPARDAISGLDGDGADPARSAAVQAPVALRSVFQTQAKMPCAGGASPPCRRSRACFAADKARGLAVDDENELLDVGCAGGTWRRRCTPEECARVNEAVRAADAGIIGVPVRPSGAEQATDE